MDVAGDLRDDVPVRRGAGIELLLPGLRAGGSTMVDQRDALALLASRPASIVRPRPAAVGGHHLRARYSAWPPVLLIVGLLAGRAEIGVRRRATPAQRGDRLYRGGHPEPPQPRESAPAEPERHPRDSRREQTHRTRTGGRSVLVDATTVGRRSAPYRRRRCGGRDRPGCRSWGTSRSPWPTTCRTTAWVAVRERIVPAALVGAFLCPAGRRTRWVGCLL